MRIVTTAAVLWISMLVAVPAARAAPLDPAHVPEDAKWVIHVDWEALKNTALVESFREQRPEMVKQARQWLQKQYGIDPQENLYGATLFSDTYEEHTGTIILLADYDLEQVKSDLMSKSGVMTTEWGDHTIYGLRKQGEEGRGMEFAIILLEGKAVFASSPEQAKAAVELLEGNAPPLQKESSKLIADIPEDAACYGAAIDLGQISRHDGVFPILRQHERIVWSTGEQDGQVFENVTLVAQSEEVAQEMKTALEGFIAFLKVWAADSEGLAQIAQDVEITIDGATVVSRYRGDTKDVINALAEPPLCS